MFKQIKGVKGRRQRLLPALPLALLALSPAGTALADITIPTPVTLPPISIGAGLRTSFTHTASEDSTPSDNSFALDSVRLYINGSVLPDIKFTFNTEYTGSPPAGSNAVEVMDAIGRFEFNDQVNIWAGRFLPPSDRANLYGPYYADNWDVYVDGVQDGYPGAAVGRDNGVAYWGQFGILKVSAGLFDLASTTGSSASSSEVISAARLQLDFWDPEPGYYLNGTYYGGKDILALGVAGQTVADRHAFSVDVLMEKKLAGVGVLTFESEYTRYDKLGGYGGFDGSYNDSNGYYGLLAFLFPQQIGMGKFQVLGKYGRAKFDDSAKVADISDYAQRTSEFDLNYIIKDFNARVSLFYKGTFAESGVGDNRQIGVGLQLQI
jgi:hypothetical protein